MNREHETANADGSKSLAGRIRDSLRYRVTHFFKNAADLVRQTPARYHQRIRPRIDGRRRKRILLIEDRVPHVYLGAGYPRSNFIIAQLVEMGYLVTLYPLIFPQEQWSEVYEDIPRRVEVVLHHGVDKLRQFLAERAANFDLIFVSRPHNMEILARTLAPHDESRIVYDAEALFCMRAIERARAGGNPLATDEIERLVGAEVGLAEKSFSITSVSDGEGRRFVERGYERVYTLSHALDAQPGARPFDAREGFLFVGPVREADAPNTDSVRWFVREIFPLIRRRLGGDVRFLVAGTNDPAVTNDMAGAGVEFLGRVGNLAALYDCARVFVAPTRYSAGIPLKILEASAHGLPSVVTPLLARQLAWREGDELLSGGDAETFADACVRLYEDAGVWHGVRRRALERIRSEYSPAVFAAQLKRVVEEAMQD